mgnify:CR=1 FL=1
MYYDDIVAAINASKETDGERSFICEMVNGSISEMRLDVLDDPYSPVPVYRGTSSVLPWFVARDIIRIVPKSECVF